MFDIHKNEAYFLASDLAEGSSIWDAPITLQQYGQYIIDELIQNKPFIMNDVLTDPRAVELDILLAKQDGIHAWLYLPLRYQGQLIGALKSGAWWRKASPRRADRPGHCQPTRDCDPAISLLKPCKRTDRAPETHCPT